MSLVADGFVAAGPLSNEAMEGPHLFHEMPKSTAASTWAHDTSTKQASVAQPTEMPGKKKEKSLLVVLTQLSPSYSLQAQAARPGMWAACSWLSAQDLTFHHLF